MSAMQEVPLCYIQSELFTAQVCFAKRSDFAIYPKWCISWNQKTGSLWAELRYIRLCCIRHISCDTKKNFGLDQNFALLYLALSCIWLWYIVVSDFVIIVIINPLTARVVGHHRWFCNQFSPVFPLVHCPLGLAELEARPFPDVVFPPHQHQGRQHLYFKK